MVLFAKMDQDVSCIVVRTLGTSYQNKIASSIICPRPAQLTTPIESLRRSRRMKPIRALALLSKGPVSIGHKSQGLSHSIPITFKLKRLSLLDLVEEFLDRPCMMNIPRRNVCIYEGCP